MAYIDKTNKKRKEQDHDKNTDNNNKQENKGNGNDDVNDKKYYGNMLVSLLLHHNLNELLPGELLYTQAHMCIHICLFIE